MFSIEGKVAIVTGASRGMGRGIAVAYGRSKAQVVVASRTPAAVESAVEQIRSEGGVALGVVCDVGVREQVFEMVAKTVEHFGKVDVLVNNAQSFAGPNSPTAGDGRQPLETFDEEDWEHLYRTGVLATLWGMKAVFPHMRDHRGGKIINVASAAAQVGLEGFAGYAATKEGIRGLSRTAAREWGKYRINVNVMNPAMNSEALEKLQKNQPEFLKKMLDSVPLGRWGDPLTDAGALAIFLASPASDYITGMTVMLDGGQFMFP